MNLMRYIAIAALTITLQWLFLQNLPLTPYGDAYFYLWAFVLLPFHEPRWRVIVFAFLLGSTMDSLEQSGGAHTVASLVFIWVKPWIENVLYGFKDSKSDEGLINVPLASFATQALILVLLHHTTLFVMENAGFTNLGDLLMRIGITTLVTTLLLSIGHLLFSRRYAA